MSLCAETDRMSQILEDLQDPAAYPHPVEDIHVVQTHASCVFLTGDYAYKVKKPVDFGFLDYTTIERRRVFCEQELILNRRLCPEMYQAVVPITTRLGRLRAGGDGVPVEWAVQMRQLREADLLSARLAADAVGPSEIERIAQVIADFHKRAAVGHGIREYGVPAIVWRIVEETLRVADRVGREELSEEARAALHRYAEQFQQEQRGLFRGRMAGDRIRDGHGDLRAQNICLDARFDGGIQVFDCIEFNDAFRYLDVAADLAYLAMDLDLAGRADLRTHLVDAYARASGDETLRLVLPFYQVYRAIVRGNIALLAAQEGEIPDRERQAQREMAAAAYDLARSYASPGKRPALLITSGFSGSGKSALARELARRLPAVHLSSDRVRKEQAGITATSPLSVNNYTAERRSAVYAALRCRAEEYLRRGERVLLDATFLEARERQAAANLAVACGAEFWILDCQCPDAVIRARLRARSADPNASDADIAVYEAQRRSYQPVNVSAFGDRGTQRYIPVNTAQSPNRAAQELMDGVVFGL